MKMKYFLSSYRRSSSFANGIQATLRSSSPTKPWSSSSTKPPTMHATQPEAVHGLKVTVLGAGSYGTAMAFVATHNAHHVTIFCRDNEQAKSINQNHRNPKRMSHVELPESITATTKFEVAVEGTSLIIHAIPAQHTPAFIERYASLLPKGVPYISTSKGIHVESSMLMSEAIPKAMGGRATNGLERAEIPIGYLSGPSFAAEMMQSHPISVTVASDDSWAAARTQTILSSKFFRVYTTDDVVGVEVGGALKNPLAIGAGLANGLGFGSSTIAALVTRGCKEMAILSEAMGGRAETLAGLSGVGDLMLTCYSSKSRNNRFGNCLAKGMTASEAVVEIGEVVEGYPTASEVVRLAKSKHLFLPLFFTLDKILKGELEAKEAFDKILSYPVVNHERFIG